MSARDRSLRLLVLAVLACSTGCGISYLAHVSYGQSRILVGRLPVEHYLESDEASPRLKEKLRLVQDVRKFAGEIGLTVTDSYTTVFDTDGEAVCWNVSACADDSFRPHTWSFPIVGKVPYKGFFERSLALEEAKELKAAHMDVLLYAPTAYSTLGWFSDPLFTPMLRGQDSELASTIIHELTHATVYIASEADFNENLAEFVGNQGAIEYFLSRDGPASPRATMAREDAEDDVVFNREISDLKQRLAKVYDGTSSREDKLAEKARVIAGWKEHYRATVKPGFKQGGYDRLVESERFNNAVILALVRYHGENDMLEAAHRKLGSSLRATVAKLKEISREKNPREALEAFAKN